MTETLLSPQTDSPAAVAAVSQRAMPAQECGECMGTGGWYRYEPALDPAPGMLYLSCVECRGSGRMAFPRG